MAQILRTANGACFAQGLNPAQWAALRYFADSQTIIPTVTAFARHHGTTTGTASQTVSALVRKGLLARRREPGDRRVNRLEPTAAGRSTLDQDPLDKVARAVETMDGDTLAAFMRGLDVILRTLGERGGDGGRNGTRLRRWSTSVAG